MSLAGTQADGRPNIKWSPLPIDICNTWGQVEMSRVPVITPAPIPFKQEHSNAALAAEIGIVDEPSLDELLHKEIYRINLHKTKKIVIMYLSMCLSLSLYWRDVEPHNYFVQNCPLH